MVRAGQRIEGLDSSKKSLDLQSFLNVAEMHMVYDFKHGSW